MADTLETLALIGTGVKAGAQVGQGRNAQVAGEFEAAQYERIAEDARGAGHAAAREQRRNTAKVLSRQRAVAAASGAGGAETPSILDIMGDTAQRGEYLENIEIYKGESRAADARDKAKAARMKGDAAFTGSILEGIGTTVGGLAKYAKAAAPSKAGGKDADDPWAPLVEEELDDNLHEPSGWRTRTVRYR